MGSHGAHTNTQPPLLALLEKWILQCQNPLSFGSFAISLLEALRDNILLHVLSCLFKPFHNVRMTLLDLLLEAHELPGAAVHLRLVFPRRFAFCLLGLIVSSWLVC